MSGSAIDDVSATGLRAIFRIRDFRRMWTALGLASLADWMGLLAITAFANDIAGGGYAEKNFAIAGVLFLRVLPALVIGPLGGYIADRLDRRTTLVVGLVLRGACFASIPLVGTLWWLFVATVLIEAVNAVWLPTKDATIPNLVPTERLEDANRVNLATTYGSALPAAALFIIVADITELLSTYAGWTTGTSADLTMYVIAVGFLAGGAVCQTMRDIPRGSSIAAEDQAGLVRTILDGWAYIRDTDVVRGLVVGIVGAFGAGGVVIGLGRVYATDLGADDAGYGVLFGCVFLGLGTGMWLGPRTLPRVSRRRLFGLGLIAAGATLAVISLIGNMVLAAVLVVVLGYFAGISWITGYTLLGLEVADDVRGRTFALVQSLIRIALALVLALGPAVAGLIGAHRWRITDHASLTYSGAQFTFLIAAAVAVVVGVSAYRRMNDRPGVTLREELTGPPPRGRYSERGTFVALEGGEGAGKSTQARLLADALRDGGYDVLLTHEPGDTPVGATLRKILLDVETGTLSHRTEALLYAADKAEHVDTVVQPALDAGKVVITDRYVDSALAYQGAGRELTRDEVEDVTRWATAQLRPHLTVLLDVEPDVGLGRFDSPDRLESEPVDFHTRVRDSFRELAAADPEHYLVVDAHGSRDEIAAAVRARLEPHLARAVRRQEQS
ncbi:dTMP kinase [Solicola gregarius]|uniref:Thymidylate kinase n=1 Tax=Solicola gregarius TaxID=2908642 RepID=A0AA46YJC2_9ACTN|nr:dTMP kinase [Solicola gregarius]UYM03389.1 dTMP kinase [Solicola gregarius]